MITISLILMVAAFVLLILAALNIPNPPRVNIFAAGMACWALAVILTGLKL